MRQQGLENQRITPDTPGGAGGPVRAAVRHATLALLLAAIPVPGTAAGALPVTEVADGVFVHQGVHASIEGKERARIANVGFVAGSRCVAVIDTGGSLEMGQELLAAVRAAVQQPVCYVINTHVHFDHLLGNAAFKGANVRFVGHAALADGVEASREFFLENFAAELGGSPSPDVVVGPDLLVKDEMELDLGERALVLTAHKEAHTYSDLTVFDRKSGILWAGDLLFVDRVPILDGSIKGWLAVQSQLEAMPATQAVPGHGPAIVPWPQAGAAQRRYLERVLADVRAGIAAGKFMEEVVETAGASERPNWVLFDEHNRRNVTKAFTELEWE